MEIRPATHADIPGILAIYNEAVLNTTATYDYEPDTLEGRTAWFESHIEQDLAVFVAVSANGQVVGWSSLSTFRARPGYRFTVENSIYVAAEHRGQGIGKLLLPPLITAARERGKHVVVAGIDAESEASLRLHQIAGKLTEAQREQVRREMISGDFSMATVRALIRKRVMHVVPDSPNGRWGLCVLTPFGIEVRQALQEMDRPPPSKGSGNGGEG